ncbi:MAG: hydroxymethylpyrimidine/phosphomethylpyrimidine kinase [Leptospirales bacterium]
MPDCPVWVFSGVDPSGGAGLHQDLRVLEFLGLSPRGVPTSLTVQNLLAVKEVFPVPGELFRRMAGTLGEVERPLGIRVGLLPDVLVGDLLAVLRTWSPGIPVVLDPVFRFGTGDVFQDPGPYRESARRLFPFVEILTPNLPEAEILLGEEITHDKAGMERAARTLLERFSPRAIYLKGGHAAGPEKLDLFLSREDRVFLEYPSVSIPGLHGGGCTLASLILGSRLLAPSAPLAETVAYARSVFQEALLWESRQEGGSRRTLVQFFGRGFFRQAPSSPG